MSRPHPGCCSPDHTGGRFLSLAATSWPRPRNGPGSSTGWQACWALANIGPHVDRGMINPLRFDGLSEPFICTSQTEEREAVVRVELQGLEKSIDSSLSLAVRTEKTSLHAIRDLRLMTSKNLLQFLFGPHIPVAISTFLVFSDEGLGERLASRCVQRVPAHRLLEQGDRTIWGFRIGACAENSSART